jgi:hypothetical protein
MSAARKRKKAKEQPSLARFDRLYDKRADRDPTYRVGHWQTDAPVKYARCPVCIGRPHHSPWFDSRVTQA